MIPDLRLYTKIGYTKSLLYSFLNKHLILKFTTVQEYEAYIQLNAEYRGGISFAVPYDVYPCFGVYVLCTCI